MRSTLHRGRAVVAAAALLIMAIGASCSSSRDDTAADQPAPAEAEQPADAPAPAEEPADEPAPAEEPAEASSSSDLPDPCSLLSTDEIAAATGNPFGPATFNEDFSSSNFQICDWTSEDPFATFQVLVADAEIGSQRESFEDTLGQDVVDVDLADGGFRLPDGSIVGVQVGGVYLQVSYLVGPDDVSAVTLGLAETAVGRL